MKKLMTKTLALLMASTVVLSFSAISTIADEAAAEVAAESDGESSADADSAADSAEGDSATESTDGESDGDSADGESDGESAGGMGQEFGTYTEIAENAGVVISNGEVTYTEGWNGTVSGDITAEGMDGVEITAEEADGVAIELAAETDVYTIKNSTISVTAGEKNNDLGYEAAFGVALGINTGELRIEDSSILSEGPRSTSVYCLSTAQPAATSLVVYNSTLESNTTLDNVWMPPFKLLAGGSRATLLMTRNSNWFVNSTVTSKTWGAISQDTVEATSYVVNTTGTCTEGGYASYITWNMYLYASQLYGAQYGLFMSGQSLIVTGTAEDAMADADAMCKTPDYVAEEQDTVIAGAVNAIAVHNAVFGDTKVAVGNLKGAILSTMDEDLPAEVTPMAADADFFMNPEMDDFGISSGTAFFFNANLDGSLILVRSMNGDFTFDDTDARTSNGVLVQTVLNYDPPQTGGHISVGVGETTPGVTVTFLNGEYTGDLLNQDYERPMYVTIGENSVLNGAVVSGTYQGWCDLWSEESLMATLAAYGYEEVPFANEAWVATVQENLIDANDVEYAAVENLGVDVTVTAGATWVVTGESTISTLTVEDGAVITAPEGQTLTVYVDADASNANSTYVGGTAIEELTAGTYTNVIITVE